MRPGKDPKKTQKDPVFLGQKTSIKSSDSSCCMYWNKSFKYTTNLYKHQNYRCKIEKSQELEQTEISEFEQQVSKLIDTNLNNSKTANKSISTLNYAINNFNNAPPIGLLEGVTLDGFIEYHGNTDRSLEEVIIHYYEKRKLHQFLGDRFNSKRI